MSNYKYLDLCKTVSIIDAIPQHIPDKKIVNFFGKKLNYDIVYLELINQFSVRCASLILKSGYRYLPVAHKSLKFIPAEDLDVLKGIVTKTSDTSGYVEIFANEAGIRIGSVFIAASKIPVENNGEIANA